MTQTGRPDLDHKVHFLGRDTQTPHFVLKAGDSCAAMAVRAYAQLLTTAGGDLAMVELAHRQADAMARWPHQKLPDMEFADEAQRKRLTYEGERRAWCWGELSDVAIAELRGRNEALDLMADVLGALEPHDDGTFVYTPPEGAVDPLSILAELMEARRDGAPKPPTNPRVARAEADARAYAKTCYVGGKRLAEVEVQLADVRLKLEQQAAARDRRQGDVAAWCAAAFGVGHASSLPQRGVRLLEESTEAYQAAGGGREMAHRLIDHVFDRPAGALSQELGGVGVTLLALANAAGLSADDAEADEVARIRSKPFEHFTARNAEKNAAGFNCEPAAEEAP
jgi:hypothetical protein